MTAKIITVINQKGGSGKSTVAMTLAAACGLRGFKTLVVDGDQQGTATQWYASGAEGTTFPATVVNLAHAEARIAKAIEEHVPVNDVIIIDTPGSLRDKLPLAALFVSDLAVIPMIPSPGDMWATSQLNELIEQAQGMRPDLALLLVMNMMQRTTLAEGSVLAIRANGGIPVANAQLWQRNAYKVAAANGSSVFAADDDKAKEESDALADEVLAVLGLPKKKPKTTTAKG